MPVDMLCCFSCLNGYKSLVLAFWLRHFGFSKESEEFGMLIQYSSDWSQCSEIWFSLAAPAET